MLEGNLECHTLSSPRIFLKVTQRLLLKSFNSVVEVVFIERALASEPVVILNLFKRQFHRSEGRRSLRTPGARVELFV